MVWELLFNFIFGNPQLENRFMKKLILIFGIILFLSACDYNYNKQIGDHYFIRCIENRQRMNIGFGTEELSEGIIEGTVFEVHWNDDYILAKRHPISKGKDVTEYYVIKKVVFGEEKASENMFGPLTLDEFEAKKKELSIQEEKMEKILFDDLK